MTSNRNPTRRVTAVDERRARALRRLGHRLFTTAEAHAAGLTRSDLRSDMVVPVMRGVHAPAGWRVDHRTRCAAALMLGPPGAHVAGLAAARLHDLPAPHHDDIELAHPPEFRPRPRTLDSRRATLTRRDVTVTAVAGVPPRTRLPVTGLPHLLGECLPLLTFVDAVVLGDAILNRLPPDVPQSCAKHRGLDDSRACSCTRLRQVLASTRLGSESPMETRLRLLIAHAGLPEPVVQLPVLAAGQQRRLDLAYPDVKVAIEYDGAHHYQDDVRRQRDHQRLDALRADGWLIIVVVARDVFHDPARTLARITHALRSRGVRTHVGDGWRAHFPDFAAAA